MTVFKICAIILGLHRNDKHELNIVNVNSYTNLLIDDDSFRARRQM